MVPTFQKKINAVFWKKMVTIIVWPPPLGLAPPSGKSWILYCLVQFENLYTRSSQFLDPSVPFQFTSGCFSFAGFCVCNSCNNYIGVKLWRCCLHCDDIEMSYFLKWVICWGNKLPKNIRLSPLLATMINLLEVYLFKYRLVYWGFAKMKSKILL